HTGQRQAGHLPERRAGRGRLAADRRRVDLPDSPVRAARPEFGRAVPPSLRPLIPTPLGENAMTVTGIITALIIGLIVGALGRLVVPGKQRIPIWLTIVVGIVAALLGTALARAIGIPTATRGVDWLELIVQVILAAVGVALISGAYG